VFNQSTSYFFFLTLRKWSEVKEIEVKQKSGGFVAELS
jgi:hypothetical protein